MPIAFISHSTPDDFFVGELESLVRAMGYDQVFNDSRSITPDGVFWSVIEQGIEECDALVVVISKASAASNWVQKEVEYARSLSKCVIPLWIETCEIPDCFKARDVIDFRPKIQSNDLVVRPVSLDGELRVEWWDTSRLCRRGLHELGALPMPTKTHLYIEALLGRPAYLYVLWIDTEGKLYPMYGWQKNSWTPDSGLMPAERVEVPGAGKTIPLEGRSGTETVVLLARQTPMTKDEGPLFDAAKVEEFKIKLSRMPGDPRLCYVFPTMSIRRPGTEEEISDPVELLHDALRDLCARFELVRAVSFANRGSE